MSRWPPWPSGKRVAVIAYGPVPSRRLGRSLGVDNLGSPKRCSYSCVYCQLGSTRGRQSKRGAFHGPEAVVAAVDERVRACRSRGEVIDQITFVPDGEPTLDAHLGEEIRALKPLGIPVAVITNATLLWRTDVRADLAAADVVSVKVDARRHATWRRMNRPPHALSIRSVLWGLLDFAAEYGGRLLSETMLVDGYNESAADVAGVASFLAKVQPHRAYLAVPTRPPAARKVVPARDEALVQAYGILSDHVPRVEVLGLEGEGPFGGAGEPELDLLGILAIHPMREDAVRRYLEDSGGDGQVAEELEASGRVRWLEYRGERFLTRRRPAGGQRETR